MKKERIKLSRSRTVVVREKTRPRSSTVYSCYYFCCAKGSEMNVLIWNATKREAVLRMVDLLITELGEHSKMYKRLQAWGRKVVGA